MKFSDLSHLIVGPKTLLILEGPVLYPKEGMLHRERVQRLQGFWALRRPVLSSLISYCAMSMQ